MGNITTANQTSVANSSITSGVVTSITNPYWIATATGTSMANTVIYSNPPKAPRRPKQKRAIPLFTFYLEEQLNKYLGKKVGRVIKSISKKCKNPPNITRNSNGTTVYEFDVALSYYTQQAPQIVQAQLQATLSPLMPERIDTKFRAVLIVNSETEQLVEYMFTMQARK